MLTTIGKHLIFDMKKSKLLYKIDQIYQAKKEMNRQYMSMILKSMPSQAALMNKFNFEFFHHTDLP